MARLGRPFATLGSVLVVAALIYGGIAGLAGTTQFQHAAQAQTGGNVPGDSLGNSSDARL
jgi:hypothetical protein